MFKRQKTSFPDTITF